MCKINDARSLKTFIHLIKWPELSARCVQLGSTCTEPKQKWHMTYLVLEVTKLPFNLCFVTWDWARKVKLFLVSTPSLSRNNAILRFRQKNVYIVLRVCTKDCDLKPTTECIYVNSYSSCFTCLLFIDKHKHWVIHTIWNDIRAASTVTLQGMHICHLSQWSLLLSVLWTS